MLKQHLRLVTRCALACAAAWILALPCFAQSGAADRSALERRHWAETRARYGAAAWPRGEVRAGLPTDLPLGAWLAQGLQSDAGLLTRSYRRTDESALPAFVLETFVADAADGSHQRLVEWLAGVQSAQRMPSLREVGSALGDAGFAGRSGARPGALAWIAFVRGNVAVRVTAFDAARTPDLDLLEIGAIVDRVILEQQVREDGSAPLKPEVRVFAAERSELKAGESVRLTLDVVDAAQGAPHLQWVVGGPGQGYVERDAQGAWRFYATAPGAVTLQVEVTGSNGTFTRAQLEMRSLDE